jgi:isopentenyl diphosphate isomerase/L-lactate dehydrogenase-like FMN-dependent dehydrogenase
MFPRSCATNRRRFLQFLAASPALAFTELPSALVAAFQKEPTLATAKDVLNVMDFEAIARRTLPPAHFAYLATGTDDDLTVAANREGYGRIQLRVRRLVDMTIPDMTVTLHGTRWLTPIVLCPVGSQKAFHAAGELAVARAAKGHLQLLSTQATTSIEEINGARPGEPVWFQLYARPNWSDTLKMIKRAEAAGCPALVWTIDLLGGNNRETVARGRRADSRDCTTCHLEGNPSIDNRRRPMIAEFPALVRTSERNPGLTGFTWDYVKRLKDATPMKILLKGIVTREDAELAIQHGVDGIVVSNHGGRAEESLRPTIECLPEVAAGVAGRVPIIIDGGVRRGTDIFKALALGATAVGVGRPYIWGLAAFGQDGVAAVLDILRRELQMVMRQAGTASIAKITRRHVVVRGGEGVVS